MNAKQIIEVVGGRKAIMALTGLKRAAISHWVTQNYIPDHWVLLLRSTYPKIRYTEFDLSPRPQKDKQPLV